MQSALGLAQKALQVRAAELPLDVLEQIVPQKTFGGFPKIGKNAANAAW